MKACKYDEPFEVIDERRIVLGYADEDIKAGDLLELKNGKIVLYRADVVPVTRDKPYSERGR